MKQIFTFTVALALLVMIILVLMLSTAVSGTTSEPPRDARIYGDEGCYAVYGTLSHNNNDILYWTGNSCTLILGDGNEQTQTWRDNRRIDRVPDYPRSGDSGPSKVKGNNGWGNGSQNAPGKSGPRNSAENGPKGKNDGRGEASGNSGRK